jgi:hypothetical protein
VKRHVPALLVVAAVGLYPLLFAGMFAGDATIHLVYARNAAHGHLFEFNPGEKTAGVTSPGYMLLLALFFRCLPEWSVPLTVKIVNLLGWYGSLTLLYLLARRLVDSRAWALGAVAVAGLLPGSAYNSTVGMENGLFAATVLLWLYLADRRDWWRPAAGERLSCELGLGLLAGLACWLRPEGLVVAPVAVTLRAWRAVRERPASLGFLVRTSVVFLLCWGALAGALVAFHRVNTGHWVPSSAASRILMGQREAFTMGPLPITWKFAVRLGAYLPLTLAWLAGTWVIATARRHDGSADTVKAAAVLSWLFFVLYSTVLGSAHLGRYTIFVMLLIVVVGLVGARHVWSSYPARVARVIPRRVALGLAAVALGSVFAGETWLRRDLGSRRELVNVMMAPTDREKINERLYEALGRPASAPVVVAYQEVQIRYWLDRRFVVRSLDGRVDGTLLKHVHDGFVDHVGYLRERGVQFLAELPNYNRDSSSWGLDRLRALPVGESVARQPLRFTKLESGFVRVDSIAGAP